MLSNFLAAPAHMADRCNWVIGLTAAEIAGIALGAAVAGALATAVSAFLVVRRRRMKQPTAATLFYAYGGKGKVCTASCSNLVHCCCTLMFSDQGGMLVLEST